MRSSRSVRDKAGMMTEFLDVFNALCIERKLEDLLIVVLFLANRLDCMNKASICSRRVGDAIITFNLPGKT